VETAEVPFDAEDAPALTAEVFDQIEAEYWDAPLVTLPDAAAVRDYMVARLVPRGRAVAAADKLITPLTITKRGVLVRCC